MHQIIKKESVRTLFYGGNDERICVRIELVETGVANQLISTKRNSDSEEIEQT